MTVGFATTTALGLVALAAVTLRLDDDAHRRLAGEDLVRQATTLARAVDVEADGTLDLTRFERSVDVDPPQRWAVMSAGSLLVAGPDQQAVPDDHDLDLVVRTTTITTRPRIFPAEDARGHHLLWSASAVLPGPGLNPAPGSVVLVGARLPGAAAHHDLARALSLSVAVLTLVTALVGHLISRRIMRPAVIGLDQQEQFLTEAAHELRTPIATLRLLLDADMPSATDRRTERRQVGRLERLLESLLLRARADASGAAPALTPLRLDQLVERVADELDRPQVRLHLDPVQVDGAVQVLSVAVRNLIENAERHGAGEITVVVRDHQVTFTDAGPGIPAARRRAVLRRGVSGQGGTGSGLALVSWAADLHHADLSLEDSPGGGLTVRLRFPVSSSPHPPTRTLGP